MTEIWKRDGDRMVLLGELAPEDGEKILDLFAGWFESLGRGRSKAVYVDDVDEAEYSQWEKKGARPWSERPEDSVFSSAIDASRFIGSKGSNVVGARLADAAKKGEKRAKVRGLTFMYYEDLKE